MQFMTFVQTTFHFRVLLISFQMQKEHSTLADAAEMWITLCCSLPRRITTNEYFLKQKKLGLTQTAIAAHILHPKYKGMSFNVKIS